MRTPAHRIAQHIGKDELKTARPLQGSSITVKGGRKRASAFGGARRKQARNWRPGGPQMDAPGRRLGRRMPGQQQSRGQGRIASRDGHVNGRQTRRRFESGLGGFPRDAYYPLAFTKSLGKCVTEALVAHQPPGPIFLSGLFTPSHACSRDRSAVSGMCMRASMRCDGAFPCGCPGHPG